MISCEFVQNRMYYFVRFCPKYKQGIVCTIDLICQIKFFCTQSTQKVILQRDFPVLQLLINGLKLIRGLSFVLTRVIKLRVLS